MALRGPLAVGVNVTVIRHVVPSGMVAGHGVVEKSPGLAPLRLTVPRDAGAVPLFPIVTDCPPDVVLTANVPNVSELAVAASETVPLATDPVPERGIRSGELGSELAIARFALLAPVAVGVKVT